MSSKSTKYYVVICGRGETPAVYTKWEDCKKCVDGFRGARYQSFNNLNDANLYMQRHSANSKKESQEKSTELPIINRTIAYVDGSSMATGAGYGVVLIQGDKVTQYCGNVPSIDYGRTVATNNQAELYAIGMTIQHTAGPLTIYSDSEYSINALTNWCKDWEVNNWMTSSGAPVANKEAIKRILDQMKDRDVHFEHIKGHAGHPMNELADRLAKHGATSR